MQSSHLVAKLVMRWGTFGTISRFHRRLDFKASLNERRGCADKGYNASENVSETRLGDPFNSSACICRYGNKTDDHLTILVNRTHCRQQRATNDELATIPDIEFPYIFISVLRDLYAMSTIKSSSGA